MTLRMKPSSCGTGHEMVIEIGGIPIALQTTDSEFVRLLTGRYGDYMKSEMRPEFTYRVELIPPGTFNPEDDAAVRMEDGEWRFERGDFQAPWSQEVGEWVVRQSANPYSIGSVPRIPHPLLLARAGGYG